MKIYELRREQFLPIPLHQAWDFFSHYKNLDAITPDDVKFKILSDFQHERVYSGMIIRYKIRPFMNIPVTWVTEIVHVDAPHFFVDDQRAGPYKLWHHQHLFEEADGGTKMTDIVTYALPFGFLGRIAHAIFVKNQLKKIFDFRMRKLDEIFGNTDR